MILAALAAPSAAQINPDDLWETRGGKMKLELRKQVLLSYGVEVQAAEKTFTLDPKAKLLFYPKKDRVGFLFRSTMRGSGELILSSNGDNKRFAAPTFIFALAWLVIVLSGVSIALLTWMISRGAASKVASLFYLTPPIAAIGSYFWFDETLSPLALTGMAVIVFGLYLLNRSKAA